MSAVSSHSWHTNSSSGPGSSSITLRDGNVGTSCWVAARTARWSSISSRSSSSEPASKAIAMTALTLARDARGFGVAVWGDARRMGPQ
jgi:hypothetical protein